MPKRFQFHFIGRKVGAIGRSESITEYYTCKNMGEALFMLHTDYEHVNVQSAWRGKEKLPIPGAINQVVLIDNGYKGKNVWNTPKQNHSIL